MLDAEREAQRAGRQVEQVAADVGVLVVRREVVLVVRGERDEVQHVAGDAALTAKEVQRDAASDRNRQRAAARGTGSIAERWAQSITQGRDREQANRGVVGLVLAAERAHFPVEVLLTEVERAFEASRDRSGAHVLVEGAATGLGDAAVDARHVLAERVVDAVAADEHVLCERTGSRRGAQHDRHGGEQLLGLTLVVGDCRFEADVVGDVDAARREHRTTLLRSQQVVVGREVVRVNTRTVSTRRRALAVKRERARATVEAGLGAGATARRRIEATRAQCKATIRGGAAAERVAGQVGRLLGEVTVTRADRLFLDVAEAHHRGEALALGADGEVVGLTEAVALVVHAEVGVGFCTVKALAQDHVDHAGDRVGTVDRRRAVLQHFDPLDRSGRDRVEIDRAAETCATDPATTVHQHESAVGAEVAQADTGFAVAAVVEGAVERRTVRGEVLDHVTDGGEALRCDIFAAQREHRLRGLNVGALDARTRDLDAGEFFGICGRRVLRHCDAGACNGRRAHCEREGDRVAELGGLQSHLSLQVSLGCGSRGSEPRAQS